MLQDRSMNEGGCSWCSWWWTWFWWWWWFHMLKWCAFIVSLKSCLFPFQFLHSFLLQI